MGLNPAMANLQIGRVQPVELFPATFVDIHDNVPPVPTLPPAMDGFEDTLVDDPAPESYTTTTNHVGVTDGTLHAPDTQVYTNDMLFGFSPAVGGMASSYGTGAAYDTMVVDTQLYEHADLNPPGPAYESRVCFASAPEMAPAEMMQAATHDCPHTMVFNPPCTSSPNMVYGIGAIDAHNEIFAGGDVSTPVWPNDAVLTSHPGLLYSHLGMHEVTNTDSHWYAYDTAQPEAPCSTPMSMASQFGSVAHGDSQYIHDADLQVFFENMAGFSSAVIEVESGSEDEMRHEVQNVGASVRNNAQAVYRPCMRVLFLKGTGAW